MKKDKIFLIGFMGVGKTYLGKRVADKLVLNYYDIDLEIEKRVELDVNQIFKEKGEDYFRKIENQILLQWDRSGIISTGGGIIQNSQNRKFLSDETNLVIWLNPSWKKVKSRIINSYRPLVLNRSVDELFELYESRIPYYEECADLQYNGSQVEALADLIKK